jgi:hypothetical protein
MSPFQERKPRAEVGTEDAIGTRYTDTRGAATKIDKREKLAEEAEDVDSQYRGFVGPGLLTSPQQRPLECHSILRYSRNSQPLSKPGVSTEHNKPSGKSSLAYNAKM